MAWSELGRALDVEWFLLLDESRSHEELEREALRVTEQATDENEAFQRWLDLRRAAYEGRTIGVRVSESLTWLHRLGLIAALLVGTSTAEALLFSSDPRSPINVLAFLFATLLWPLGLLLLGLTMFALRGRLGGPLLLAELYGALLSLAGRWQRRVEPNELPFTEQWRALRRRTRRYQDIEMLSLAMASQGYALCFHLGAALSLLRSALFTDLTFAWSTTNHMLSWRSLAQTLEIAVTPWCLPSGWGCVPADLVRQTEFSSFTHSFVHKEGILVSGAWWAPLFALLIAYGVLPRGLALLLFLQQLRRRAAQMPQRVLEMRRVLYAGVAVKATHFSTEPDGAEPSPGQVLARPRAVPQSLTPCWFLTWRGAELSARKVQTYAAKLGFSVAETAEVGGVDFALDQTTIERLSTQPEHAVLIAVEGWEAPDKATRRFVEMVRKSGKDTRPVFVVVVCSPKSEASEMSVWRDRLGLLQDPYLSVDRLVDDSQLVVGREAGA